VLSIILSIVNSFIKIAAVTSITNAIKTSWNAEPEPNTSQPDFSHDRLLILSSVFLVIYEFVERELREYLLRDAVEDAKKDLANTLLNKTNRLSHDSKKRLSPNILSASALTDKQSQLTHEVINNLLPPLLDIMIGGVFVAIKFNPVTGLAFLTYAALQMTIVNNIIIHLTELEQKAENFKQAKDQYEQHYYDRTDRNTLSKMYHQAPFEDEQHRKELAFLIQTERDYKNAEIKYKILTFSPQIIITLGLCLFFPARFDLLLLVYFNIYANSVRDANHAIKATSNLFDLFDKYFAPILNEKESAFEIGIEHPSSPQKKTQTPPAIEAKDVSITREENPVITKLDINIKPGEKIGIVGPTGSGKSSFALALQGLIPKKGELKIEGKDIEENPHCRRRMVIIPQEDKYFVFRSIGENIAYGDAETLKQFIEGPALQSGCSTTYPTETDIVADILKMVKLEHLVPRINDKPGTLSAGELQRLNIARALLALQKNVEADIFIADEILANLDPCTAKFVMDHISKRLKNYTAIWIDHKPALMRNYVHRFFVMDGGAVVQTGTHDELMAQENGLYAKLWKEQSLGSEVQARAIR
jgi:ABC-type multidrug transport system fused ATPase/permease subunit